MKVLHINTSNNGGAGIAALRLHEQMLNKGIDSKFLSLYSFPSNFPEQYQFKKRDYALSPLASDLADFGFKVMKKMNLRQPLTQEYESKYLAGRPDGFELFSFPFSKYRIEEHPLVKAADIVHLHWVSDSFLDYESFFANTDKKIVWTLHDMFPFTGGCHHSDGCLKFMADCDVCPQLTGTRDPSYSSEIIRIKERGLKLMSAGQMKVISPSQWLMKLSEQSRLFRRFDHVTIPNMMNENVFKLRDKKAARARLLIPADKKVILFVAHNFSNIRKGGKYLLEALEHLKGDEQLLLCSVGSEGESVNFPIEHLPFGYVSDEERMADIYTAADLFVLPSMAENFPNTICESLLCGTPVVAFSVGGIPELIDNTNGKLVSPFDTAGFAAAISGIFETKEHYSRESIAANAHTKLNSEVATNRYLAVYTGLLNDHA